MSVAIRVDNIGKRYQLKRGDATATYRTLRETLSDTARSLLGRSSPDEIVDFWALRDVGFEIPAGEAVGIIGRNGAGKSTLLKVLSRITKPTTGRVELHGRVGSLLEVGTGFHPELTGRENIFLNGSLIGMSRKQIQARFDEIVAFAGTEKFLETPVKRYSSGMFVRLAFSVAAHLRPEILIVDEVLAVGDAAFQRRCIDRMRELTSSGSTLLFVSHNMDIIPKLCQTAIYLKGGRVECVGPSQTVMERYLEELLNSTSGDSLADRARRGNGEAQFESFSVMDTHGLPANTIVTGQDLRFVLDIRAKKKHNDVSIGIAIKNLHESRYITSLTDEVNFGVELHPGVQRFECHFKNVRLRPGRQVAIELWLFDGDTLDHIEIARLMDVVEVEPCGFTSRADHGAYLCDYSWKAG